MTEREEAERLVTARCVAVSERVYDRNALIGDITVALISARERGRVEWMQWRPIETAPKDGTNILVYTAMTVRIAYYDDGEEGANPSYPLLKKGWRMLPGHFVDVQATHWMPPPAPPTSEDKP